jgi:hypothetical protein
MNRNKRSLSSISRTARGRRAQGRAGADPSPYARPQVSRIRAGLQAIRKVKPDIVYVGAYGLSADGLRKAAGL